MIMFWKQIPVVLQLCLAAAGTAMVRSAIWAPTPTFGRL